jgi:hypothetical protein
LTVSTGLSRPPVSTGGMPSILGILRQAGLSREFGGTAAIRTGTQ